MDAPPNQSIYVNNLYEKIPKEDLKKSMHALFGQFGKILDVVALKTYRLRGQAWIVFSDVAAATNALKTMQGFPYFDKPIRISYAKGKSDAIAKLDGTFKDSKKDRSKKNKDARDQALKKEKGAAAPARKAGGVEADAAPNKILFAQNLPETTNDAMLSMLFQQFEGFREVRMVDARPGIAFIEFQTEAQAGVAKTGLDNFKITPTQAMRVTYAKA